MSQDLLGQLFMEAQAYRQFEDIEKLVESGVSFEAIPLQPLFLAIRMTSADHVANILPKLSPDQRQALLDIDIWQKDEIDPNRGGWWIGTYGRSPSDEVRADFAQSEDFLLALKSQCVVYTFDDEEPEYPEHDNYFLTEDHQLLIEYPESFPFVQELQQLVKDLYSLMGVENAYSHLIKMVSDSYMVMEEENYQRKKERLRDFGFVDYYDFYEMDVIFPSIDQMKEWIIKRPGATGGIDANMKNQTLHSYSVVPYQNGLSDIRDALKGVEQPGRLDYLQFNFVRLVNARIAADESLKGGAVAMSRSGSKARQRLELGFSFAAQVLKKEDVFKHLDFSDVYRVGNTLLEIQKRRLKKVLTGTPFEGAHENFLGSWWNGFLSHSLSEPVKFKFDGSSQASEVCDMKTYDSWVKIGDTFVASMPFIKKFHLMMEKLKADDAIQGGFYLNYELADIDFEAIMLSSLINFWAKRFEDSNASKLGVALGDLKAFYRAHFKPQGKEWLLKGEEGNTVETPIQEFLTRFGLSEIPGMSTWVRQIMVEQMNGYEIDVMPDEDFEHVGGPILLVQSH